MKITFEQQGKRKRLRIVEEVGDDQETRERMAEHLVASALGLVMHDPGGIDALFAQFNVASKDTLTAQANRIRDLVSENLKLTKLLKETALCLSRTIGSDRLTIQTSILDTACEMLSKVEKETGIITLREATIEQINEDQEDRYRPFPIGTIRGPYRTTHAVQFMVKGKGGWVPFTGPLREEKETRKAAEKYAQGEKEP